MRNFSGKKNYSGKSGSSSDSRKGGKFKSSGSASRKKSDDRSGKRFQDNDGFKKKSYGSDEERPRRKFSDDKDGGFKKKSFGSSEGRPRKRFSDDKDSGFKKKSFGSSEDRPRRKFSDDKDGGFKKKSFGSSEDRPRRRFSDDKDSGFKKKSFGSAEDRPKRRFGDEKEGGFRKKSFFGRSDDRPKKRFSDERPSGKKSFEVKALSEDEWTVFDSTEDAKAFIKEQKSEGKKKFKVEKEFKFLKGTPGKPSEDGSIRLNRFIANTGLCSRREADDMIEAGVIKINGKVVTELGSKVMPGDTVHYGDQLLKREQLVYVLLNKPKDYITTMDDPKERKTVLDLVADACDERIYPVGRLDRNTTGLLLLTNDGDLAERLMHPRYGVQKIYHVTLDKNLKAEHFNEIQEGFELEDGFIKADDLSFVGEGKDHKQVGISLHSGKNRIVRRIFEHFGYDVIGLDRVLYAGLTKKNLPRGRWRFLTPDEVSLLKLQVGGQKKKSFHKKKQ